MLKRVPPLLLLIFSFFSAYSQAPVCPQNIGFELGVFANWECYTGSVTARSGQTIVNVQSAQPVETRHRIISREEKLIDYYGDFPLESPNGSKYIVKLGNDQTRAEAERISYTMEVPTNLENYYINFNYAIVFENPTHAREVQPKFTAVVYDLTTNTSSSCASLEFIAPGYGGGFKLSENPKSLSIPVYYKDWAPVLLNLTDYRGHTIRLEFTTNDCTQGGHFGYAYIDFNETCTTPITGNVTCESADSLTLSAIPGFETYRWFNVATAETLGTDLTLSLSPAPAVGTRIGVEVVPFNGLGCPQTMYTTIVSDIDMHLHDPPPDCIFADLTASSVTAGSSLDIRYSYWRDDAGTIPVENPRRITEGGIYYIKGTIPSGCYQIRPVTVTIIKVPPVAVTIPAPVTFPRTQDITSVYTPVPGLKYSYWTNQLATIPLASPAGIRKSGVYYIRAENTTGCFVITPVELRVIIPDIVAGNTFTPNGDGVNDYFTVFLSDQVQVKQFRIFNRYGQVVFSTADIYDYWGGLSKGSEVPAGVYYWVLDALRGTERFVRSGSVTVIR